MPPVDVVLRCQKLAADQLGVITRPQALAAGLTPGQWRRSASGLLVPLLPGAAAMTEDSRTLSDPDLQRCQAALLLAGDPLAGLCVGSGLRAHGIEGSPSADPEHVHMGPTRWHQRKGLQRHWFSAPAAAFTAVRGMRVTTPLRTLYDACRLYDDAHLLSAIDSALHGGALPTSELEMLTQGAKARSSLLALADGRRESPFESRAALLMHVGGIHSVVPQVWLALAEIGRIRVDFLIEDGVVVECDGRKAHDDIPTRYRDRLRHEALERAGYVVIRLIWSDVVAHPEATLARIRAAILDMRSRSRGLLVNARVLG